MSLRKSSLFAALAIAALCQSAQAGIIVQTKAYGPSDVPFTANLVFNQFNTSLGTLNSVKIILSENGTVTSQVVNIGPAGSYTNFTASGSVTATGPDGSTVTSTLTTLAGTGTIGAGSLTNATVKDVNTITGGSSVSNTLTGSSILPYEGNGTTTYTVTADGFITVAGTKTGSGVYLGGNATLQGTVEIDYNYTAAAVPEPASLAMVTLGLGGIFAARRYRRRAV